MKLVGISWLAAVSSLLFTLQLHAQGFQSADALEVVDSNGTRVGAYHSGNIYIEFGEAVYSVGITEVSIVGGPLRFSRLMFQTIDCTGSAYMLDQTGLLDKEAAVYANSAYAPLPGALPSDALIASEISAGKNGEESCNRFTTPQLHFVVPVALAADFSALFAPPFSLRAEAVQKSKGK